MIVIKIVYQVLHPLLMDDAVDDVVVSAAPSGGTWIHLRPYLSRHDHETIWLNIYTFGYL
jgi:hypothetical protein